MKRELRSGAQHGQADRGLHFTMARERGCPGLGSGEWERGLGNTHWSLLRALGGETPALWHGLGVQPFSSPLTPSTHRTQGLRAVPPASCPVRCQPQASGATHTSEQPATKWRVPTTPRAGAVLDRFTETLQALLYLRLQFYPLRYKSGGPAKCRASQVVQW